MDVIIRNYHKEQNPKLERAKKEVIKQIAQNPITFVNFHRLGYYIEDIIYNED